MSLLELVLLVFGALVLAFITAIAFAGTWLDIPPSTLLSRLRAHIEGNVFYVVMWTVWGLAWAVGTTVQCWLLWSLQQR